MYSYFDYSPCILHKIYTIVHGLNLGGGGGEDIVYSLIVWVCVVLRRTVVSSSY